MPSQINVVQTGRLLTNGSSVFSKTGAIQDGCTRADEVNPVLMQKGASFKQPMLWIYGDHDPYYKLAHSRASFNAFKAAGGQGEFLEFQPAAGRDGHMLLNEPSIWTQALDSYLTGLFPIRAP